MCVLLPKTRQVSYLVLDEADKLLAMGFAEQVDTLLAAASNPTITRALFSATLPEKVRVEAVCLHAQAFLRLPDTHHTRVLACAHTVLAC